jgi:hypothetical protein
VASNGSTFDPYEYVGLIAPGSVVAVGLFLQWPHAKDAILSKDFSLGSFGVFLICSFVLGHLVSPRFEVSGAQTRARIRRCSA